MKSTGLHASDLVKPKAKKKDPRAAAAAVNVQHNLHQSHAATQHTSSASTSTATAPGAAALTSAGQQLIQTLLGLQPGSLGGQDGLASSNALSQAWTSQSVQQVCIFYIIYLNDSTFIELMHVHSESSNRQCFKTKKRVSIVRRSITECSVSIFEWEGREG